MLREYNFINGSNVTITVVDNTTTGEADVTIAASGGTSVTWANDLVNSSSTHQYVSALSFDGSGAGGKIAIKGTATYLSWSSTGVPLITQDDAGGSVATDIILQPQNGTGSNRAPGNLIIQLTDPTGSGAFPSLKMLHNATQNLRIGRGGPNSNYTSIWLGDATGTTNAATDYTLASQGSTVILNAPTGNSLAFTIGAGNNVFQVDSNQTQQLAGQIVKQLGISGTYTVDTSATFKDYILLMSGNAFTVTLPTPTAGRVLIFVDSAGNAATQNKTLSASSGNINGSGTYVMNVNRAAIAVIADGSNWFVFGEYNGTVI